jgi:very-short-patch-repair endonuclease
MVAGDPPSHLQRCWAVSLAWPARVISHRSAALLLGWPVAQPDSVDVVAERSIRAASGVRVHIAPLPLRDRTRINRWLHVTAPRRTAIDCLATGSFDEALLLYGWLITRRLLTRADLTAALRERHARHGTGQLERLLRFNRRGALSEGERQLHRVFDRGGLTGWRADAEIWVQGHLIARADVLFEVERVVVEFDGRRAHSSREAFVRDRRRQNRLQRGGYLVLRYTWADVTERPDAVLAEIRDVLRQRRAAG